MFAEPLLKSGVTGEECSILVGETELETRVSGGRQTVYVKECITYNCNANSIYFKACECEQNSTEEIIDRNKYR